MKQRDGTGDEQEEEAKKEQNVGGRVGQAIGWDRLDNEHGEWEDDLTYPPM